MTLVLLGIDALDYGLIEDFGETDLLLETSGQLETFSHTYDRPHTIDVWPSIATGVHPREHAVSATGEWDNPLVDVGARLVKGFESATGFDFPGHDKLEETAENMDASWNPGSVETDTMFDGPGRHVHNWPGVENNEFLLRAWSLIYDELYNDEIDKSEFVTRMKAQDESKYAWVERMIDEDFSLVASHFHAVDSFSHAFSDDREQLADLYAWCTDRVNRVRDRLKPEDDLLIVSDHGMETEWLCEDFTPADHSWRAVAASTANTVPEDVFSVRSWVDDHVEEFRQRGEGVDLPEERLKDLGYL